MKKQKVDASSNTDSKIQDSQTPEKKETPLIKTGKSNSSVSTGSSKLVIVAMVFGVLLAVTALVFVIFLSLKGTRRSQEEITVVTGEELLINSALDSIDRELQGILDSDFDDFSDEELAQDAVEEELDSALDDLDGILNELDNLDTTLGDFSDEELSL